MRQGYGRDVDEGDIRLVRRRPLRPEVRDWYGPGDVVPYFMPHRTHIDEVQRPDKWTPRAHVRSSRSVDAYQPAMPPPPHFARASTDLHGRRHGLPVYEEDEDDSDERWTRPRTRVRTPERVRAYQNAQKSREPTPESISPPGSSEDEEEEKYSDEDEIEVVVEEEDEEEEESHRHHHGRHRYPGHQGGLSAQVEKRHRGRHRMPSPSTSDEIEMSRLRASSERGSPARRLVLRREVSDDARHGPPQRCSSVIARSRPPVASRRATKAYESIETVHERPRRSQTIQTVQHSSWRPPSNVGSHYEESSRNTSPNRPAQLRDCKGCLDEVPASRCPKLDCGHRMCHSCLKRRFKQAIADPKQIPPTCCTSDHIPLEFVDRLFDMQFKKMWNRRFADYSIGNRLYCPSRRCGEWIQSTSVYRDRDTDRLAARCDQCNTKVCVACNGRWHFSRKCPRDDETEMFLEYVRNEHLKRCCRCGSMAELKEGGNHMICRCGAEFCMVCGHKPKRCECPWFNYDASSPERPERINIVVPRGGPDRQPPEERRSPRRKQKPSRGPSRPQSIYDEEAILRQEEEMAREPQYYHVEDGFDHMGDHGGIDDYSRRAVGAPSASRPGYEMGLEYPPEDQLRAVGREPMERRLVDRFSGGRHGPGPMPGMDAPPAFVRAIEQDMMGSAMRMPPPVRGSMYGGGAEHHERVIVEREPSHYGDSESYYSHSSRSRRGTRRSEPRKDSELAGLVNGRGSGVGRVDMWRSFVEPGDPEGELAAAAAASA